MDLSFRLARGSSRAAGVLLRAWLHADADSAQPSAAAAVVDWDARTLEVFAAVYPALTCSAAALLIAGK